MTVQNRILVIERLKNKSETSSKEARLLFEEGFYGTAISRAYYSMFYLAQAALATRDIYRKKHSAVLSVFAEQFTKSGIVSKIIYRKLSKAFKERQVADYDFEISKTKVDAEQVLNYAEEFAKEVVSFLDKWTEENRSNG